MYVSINTLSEFAITKPRDWSCEKKTSNNTNASSLLDTDRQLQKNFEIFF